MRKTKNNTALLKQKFQQAQYLQQTGRLVDAEIIYVEILKHTPAHSDCLHYLGMLYFQKGDLKKAEHNIQRSIELTNNPTYLCNYALLANQQKNTKKAISLLLTAIKLEPDKPKTWFNLGCIYSEIGDLRASENAYQHAIKLDKKYIKALFNLLYVQTALGKENDASATVDMIMKFQPNSPEQYHTLGLAISRLNVKNSIKIAIDYLKKAINDNPDSIEAYRALATLYMEGNQVEKALFLYENILKKEPNYQAINIDYAMCLVKSDNTKKGMKIFNDILAKDKENLTATNGLATGYRLTGKFSEAGELFNEVIKRDEHNISAYYGLSNCKKFTDDDYDFIRKLETLVDKKKDASGYFGLGKIHNDLRDYEKAIDSYRKGNSIRNSQMHYDREIETKKIDNIINIFSQEFIEKYEQNNQPSDQLIFILGAPRSGTTLIEQIISAHSDVFGAGELPYIMQLANGYSRDELSTKSYPERFANENNFLPFLKDDAKIYLDKINKFVNDDSVLRITDKMPGNYKYIGYIFLMFPNVKVINTQRNPIDTCLSIFFQNFNSGHRYSFDLNNLVFWYQEYVRLMKYWRTLFGERMLIVDYDSVVSDTENMTKKIIKFCDLPWEEQCLSFYESERTIVTASNWQVRQPIYKTSQEKWRNYGNYIPELIDGLSELE